MGRKSNAEKERERSHLSIRMEPGAFKEIQKLAAAVNLRPTVYCTLAARGLIPVDRSVLEEPDKK